MALLQKNLFNSPYAGVYSLSNDKVTLLPPGIPEDDMSEISEALGTKIEIITIPALSDNYIWLLRNHSKKLTTVIDPSEAEPVEEVLLKNNWKLNQIVNTHHHYDHTNGNLKLKEKYSAVLIAPKLEQDKIQNISYWMCGIHRVACV